MKLGPDYYLKLARGDYYLKGGEPLGEWFGRGTTDSKINLSGTVKAKPLKNLLRRYSPDGNTALTQIQNHQGKNARQGYDLTFSSSKSFSTLWSQADREEREIFQYIHAIAVRKALTYLEETACFIRRGKGGTKLEKAKAIIAVFAHGTSRAGDPNYHSHCLWMHTAIGEKGGKPGTIESHMLFKHKMAAGAIFRATETQLLKEMCGVEIERDRSCYRIKGVPKELEAEFSKRSEQIKGRLRDEGRSGAKAAAEAALKTRGKKEHIPRQTSLRLWKETGTRLGWGPNQARELFREGEKRRAEEKEDLGPWEREVKKEALKKLTHQQSSFTRRELVRFLAEESQVKGIGADRVLELSEETLGIPEIVALGTVEHEERFTTKELLAIEAKMMGRVSRMAMDTRHDVSAPVLCEVIAKRPTLTAEQQAALCHAAKGSIVLVEGDAGTGKTYLLDAIREAYSKEGYTVCGAALAGVAADSLREGANIKDSKTVARFLMDLKPQPITLGTFQGKTFSSPYALAKFAENVHKPKATITEKTVLILDEAAMIGTRQMSELVQAVNSAGGKVVMVGDSKQLQSIEAGGAFKAIRDTIGSSRLTKVIRQRLEWQKAAARSFAEGDAAAGLRAFEAHSLLTVEGTRREAIRNLVRDWKALTSSQEESLIFCGTNLDAVNINRLCQEARLEGGELGRAAIKVGSEFFHVGDRVLFTKNSKALSVRNGNIGTVVAINLLRDEISVDLGKGKSVVVPLKDYQDLKHGYCVTTHKGQGKTVEQAFVLLGGTMQDREISYVQTTRSRGDTRLYCDTEDGEVRELTRQMGKSHQKELATTVMKKAHSLRQGI